MSMSMSFKEFMDEVEGRLKTYSPDTLCEIIVEWAKSIHPSKRREFLEKLKPLVQKQEIRGPDEGLINEIRNLAERVKNGDYCDGWGWDDEIREERDWGDESWADEVDIFFEGAREAMMAGDYRLAQDAYGRLFDILDMSEEPGHLPGSSDPENMLDTDFGEARACYLRSVYMSSPSDKRPTKLLEAMRRFRYHIGDHLNLRSIINAEVNQLPEFSQFLSQWTNLLEKTDDGSARYLLREAVMLSGGTAAIAELAREKSAQNPRAYVDWIKALEKEKDYDSMLEAAKDGLSNVPKDYASRAEIALEMVKVGEHFDDEEIQLVGWREAFYSDPSLSNLLSLIVVANQRDCTKEEIESAIYRIVSLLEKEEKSQHTSFLSDIDRRPPFVSVNLLNQAYLLAGRYKDALHLCKKKGALGWSYGHNPKGLVIPFFLVLLSEEKNKYPAKNIEKLWEEAVENTIEFVFNKHDVGERFRGAMKDVFHSIQLSQDEEKKYLRLCIEEIGRRVDAIVGEKHRRSYYKAADLLAALAEVLANRGVKSKGIDLIEKYRQKYHRHSAFKKELAVTMERSKILQ